MKPYVLILEGGRSVEYEVSLRSSAGIQKALRLSGYNVGVIRIEKDGSWGTVQGDWISDDRTFSLTADPTRYINMKQIVVFPMLHGAYGEDGTMQGLLELANLPYVGCGVLASALGLHKGKQKELFSVHGLTVAPWMSCTRYEWKHDTQHVLDRVAKAFAPTDALFVKPMKTGSSVGVSKVTKEMKLADAIDQAFLYHEECIIEQSIQPMRELEVSVLGTTNPRVSVIGEIVPDREFYDYDAKYSDTSKTKLVIDPSDIASDIKEKIRVQAAIAFETISCSGLARVDFFLHDKTVIINEINTMPGFTTISMYPKLWEASGIPFDELCSQLVECALDVWGEKQKNKMTL